MAVIGLSGGDELDRRLTEIVKKLGNGRALRVGFLEGATYPDGKPVAMIAAIHEFGAPDAHIPARPYFRQMISANSPKWGGALGRVLVAADYDAAVALGRMGDGIKGQLQQSIRELGSPALKAETVQRKGFDKPLIDTGHMLNSVDYEVTS